MKIKRFTHACDLSGRTATGGKLASRGKGRGQVKPDRKEMLNVYNKFYRNQVAALYRAVRKDV